MSSLNCNSRHVILHISKVSNSGRHRIRHKKCDETRPICINCSSTLRTCEGYTDIPPLDDLEASSSHGAGRTEEGLSKRDLVYFTSTHVTKSQSNRLKALALKSGIVNRPSNLVDPSQICLTTRERWALDYFWKSVCFRCSVYLHDDFWHKLVQPLTAMQPAVKHAAIALGSRLLQFRATCLQYRRPSGDLDIDPHQTFMLEQASRSITLIVTQ